MSVPPFLAGLAEVRGAFAADPRGQLLDPAEGDPRRAAADAEAVGGLAAAGRALGLNRLELVQVKGARSAALAAVHDDGFLMVDLDPGQRTTAVERALQGWAPPSRPPPLPGPRPPAPGPAAAPGRSSPAAPPRLAPAAPGQSPDELWAALRRALVRGHLTEAAARQRALATARPAGAGRPGSEPVPPADLDAAVQQLTEGIGSVLAGDTLGGSRTLRALVGESQPNLSLRWLALHWSARAALGSDGLAAARQHVKDALAVSRQLDVEARAVSQLVAAELLARAGDHATALTWLSESRSRFERISDRWGLGQAWLAEARIRCAADGPGDAEAACAEAARRAWEADPAWDGPPIFLAGRALMRGEPAAAEAILAEVRTPAADRMRQLADAVRRQAVSQDDASDFLRVHHAPPTAQAIRVLERIAAGSPRFHQAQEALAWMLLKLGRYDEACDLFTGLMAQPLGAGDRALAMLGLSCIANARRTAEEAAPPAPGARPANGDPGASAARPAGRPSDSSLLPRNVQMGGLDAVFSGRLAVFSLPDLLEFLRSARRTGLLVFSSAAGMASMRFREGWIAGAACPGAPSVGELLVRAGKLPAEALRTVTADPFADQPDLAMAELLVRRGLVDAASAQEALRQHIGLALRELLTWKDGEFAFTRESEGTASSTGIPVQVDAQTLLLNLFKEMDEASRDAAPAGAHA